jgi:tetratricopeptide (TPR) repeat protein
VPLSQQPTYVGAEPRPESRVGLVVGLAAAGVLLVAAGAGTAWLVFGGEPPPAEGAAVEPAAAPEASASAPREGAPDSPSAAPEPASEPAAVAGADAPEDAPEGPAGSEPPAGAGEGAEAQSDAELEDAEAEAAEEEPADAEAAAAEEELAEADEPEPSEAGSEAAAGGAVPREEIEAFELDRPRASRRARRMSESQRRRMANRLKGRALRAYRADEHAEAERLYREALTYNSWDVAAVEGLARATAQQGRYPEALAWARLAVDRNPRSGTAYRVLGDVWRQAGYPDEAARAYRRGLVRSPRDRWLRRRLSEVRSE